jgi:hypothetical protein
MAMDRGVCMEFISIIAGRIAQLSGRMVPRLDES